jgi:hypothetical protein
MINRPSLPILHFEQSQLVIGAAARRSVEDTNFFVMQIAQHKVEQVGSCNQVPANSAIIEGQKLKPHAITRTANLIVLPTCRTVNTRTSCPRATRRNSSCHFRGEIPRTSMAHSTGSMPQAMSLAGLIMINLQKRLRQACLYCRLVVELVEHTLDNLINGASDIVLDCNVGLRVSGLDVPSHKTVDRLTQCVQSRNCSFERPFLLRLRHDLIDASKQAGIDFTQIFV